MKISLKNREAQLHEHLTAFKSLPLNFETIEELPEKIFQAPVISGTDSLQHYDFDFLFRYHIFPSQILNFFGEWELQNRKMEVGDIIVQQIKIPPAPFSFKLIFGVRVLSVYRDHLKAGFSYGALEGHPETGVNEFSFFLKASSLMAQVKTKAKPGLFLSKVLSPLFTKPYVAYCNHQALLLMKERFIQCNSPT